MLDGFVPPKDAIDQRLRWCSLAPARMFWGIILASFASAHT
jgi:hypothetical protein